LAVANFLNKDAPQLADSQGLSLQGLLALPAFKPSGAGNSKQNLLEVRL
jgi:hypothetical protein